MYPACEFLSSVNNHSFLYSPSDNYYSIKSTSIIRSNQILLSKSHHMSTVKHHAAWGSCSSTHIKGSCDRVFDFVSSAQPRYSRVGWVAGEYLYLYHISHLPTPFSFPFSPPTQYSNVRCCPAALACAGERHVEGSGRAVRTSYLAARRGSVRHHAVPRQWFRILCRSC